MRHAVVMGENSCGNHSKPGAPQAVLMPIVRACRLRDMNRSHRAPGRAHGGSHSIRIAHAGSGFSAGLLNSYLSGAAGNPIPLDAELRKQGSKRKISRTY
jgi:hypothetical protein